MKLLTVVGARPQFIKAAVISRNIAEHNLTHTKIFEEIIHTGQHYDDAMSDMFFRDLKLPKPVVNLNVNKGTHGEMTGQMLEKLEQQMLQRKPDCVLVYGDTNSTLAAALAAAKLKIPIAHIEAGLRSYNRNMPEEINRVMTDHLSSILFGPTQQSIDNLTKEGITKNVSLVGDVMFDSFKYYRKQISDEARQLFMAKHNLRHKEYILATCHRAENTESKQKVIEILETLGKLAKEFKVIFPMHPRTQKHIEQYNLSHLLEKILVLPPATYEDMIILLEQARFVITDSGGLQKEAWFSETPCITLRTETEWPETLVNNNNRLSPPVLTDILSACLQASKHTFIPSLNAFGDGSTGRKIVDKLLSYCNH